MVITPGYYWFRCLQSGGELGEWEIVKVAQHPSFTREYLVAHFFGGGISTVEWLLEGNYLKAEFEPVNAK